jgi:hypothetical protein
MVAQVKRGQAVFFSLNGAVVLGQVLAGNTKSGVLIRNANSGHVCYVKRSQIVNIASQVK